MMQNYWSKDFLVPLKEKPGKLLSILTQTGLSRKKEGQGSGPVRQSTQGCPGLPAPEHALTSKYTCWKCGATGSDPNDSKEKSHAGISENELLVKVRGYGVGSKNTWLFFFLLKILISKFWATKSFTI